MNERPNKNWWERNWKWCVPLGCLGLVALLVCFVAAILGFVFGMMKSSDAYKDAVAQARVHPEVQQALGTPIKEGKFVTGSIKVNGGSGTADLAIPISGPTDKATIYAEAEKSAGQWSFSTLVVEIKKTNQRIDLLE